MDLKRELQLPEGYAVAREPPALKIAIDPAIAYTALLEELGVAEDDIDQYWLEVAYQCAKMDAQAAVLRAGGDFGFEIKIANRPEFALANHPPGRGIEAATQGSEARQHYKRLRGFVPGV